jgi:hypothetical protein
MDPSTTRHATRASRPTGDARRPQDEEDGRRRGGLVVLLLVGFLVVLVGMAGVAFLGGDDDGEPAGEGEPAAAAVTTTEPNLPILTPTDAALALYVAWQRGDDVDADRAATDDAEAEMFAIDTMSAAGLEFTGCAEPADGSSECTWEREGATLTMDVTAPDDDAQPEVTAVRIDEG